MVTSGMADLAVGREKRALTRKLTVRTIGEEKRTNRHGHGKKTTVISRSEPPTGRSGEATRPKLPEDFRCDRFDYSLFWLCFPFSWPARRANSGVRLQRSFPRVQGWPSCRAIHPRTSFLRYDSTFPKATGLHRTSIRPMST